MTSKGGRYAFDALSKLPPGTLNASLGARPSFTEGSKAANCSESEGGFLPLKSSQKEETLREFGIDRFRVVGQWSS